MGRTGLQTVLVETVDDAQPAASPGYRRFARPFAVGTLASLAFLLTATSALAVGHGLLPQQLRERRLAPPSALAPSMMFTPGTRTREQACADGWHAERTIDLDYAAGANQIYYWYGTIVIAYGRAADPALLALALSARSHLLAGRMPEASNALDSLRFYCEVRTTPPAG
ncbi:hypothetical protein ACFYVL_08615 [Streptomyces sp. NPDC004111]|uniref:hypothetical protein n=1 Tax=Streptomyces sp. NPDC004111 TaxID=3364690 RepID=UPI003677EC1A